MIRFNNYARPTEKRDDLRRYQWRVFVDEPPSVLDTIRSVEYVLHPTFPEPVQVRTNADDKFALETGGWGEFDIAIRIVYSDGQKEDLTYRLDLRKSWPQETASV